jgi:hypothetical protein
MHRVLTPASSPGRLPQQAPQDGLAKCPSAVPTIGHWLLACVSAGELLQAEIGSPVMFSLPPGGGLKAKDESFLEVSWRISETSFNG